MSTTDMDPVTVYLDRLEAQAKRLHAVWRRTQDPADYKAWAMADVLWRSGRWECLAEVCPQCDGDEEVVVGYDMGTHLTPPQAIYAPCPTCHNNPERGWALPEQIRKYREETEN